MTVRLALLLGIVSLASCRWTADYPPALSAPGPDKSADLYSVTWGEHYFPARVERSSMVTANLSFRNTSRRTWNSWVHLSYFWTKESAPNPPAHGTASMSLSRPVAPGDTVVLDRVVVSVPDEPGRYRLTFELFNHTVAWFSERGAAVLSVPVDVR